MADEKKIDHGGFAFPTSEIRAPNGMVISPGSDGMSLRDWFAGQAVQAAVSGHIAHYGHENYWPPKDIASYAYEVADALIADRKGGAQ
ncbi:hypothetical protein U8C35_07625 [Sinorhizobium medicae]|uniref:hypothetical protein n=1 Tax=Sinorhizobium medicae TaxID=110321 RepID=UPI002AF6B169|nr:hypothetical protein [Sinorhizobium medicae]WQO60280.1 hypothetical protein U8C35_07625 [Sinorhizobium medicae]